MYKIIITITVLFYILYRVYFNIKFPFWSRQPVFHFHHLKYWIYPQGIIQHDIPITKFYDSSIKFSDIELVTSKQMDDIIQLIQHHYLRKREISYSPSKSYFLSYFEKYDHPCYLGLKYNKNYINQNNQLIQHNKLISVITGKQLKCILHKKHKFTVNYIDFLCVDKKFRKKGIAPQIIYSFLVKQFKNNHLPISLFKREGTQTFFVPLCFYKSYGYSLDYFSPKQTIQTTLLTPQHTELLFHHENSLIQKFDCVILPPYSNIKHLIENETYIIYGIFTSMKVFSLYFFRKTCTEINKKSTIECFASINQTSLNNFYLGFLNAVQNIRNKYKTNILIIENISDNYLLLNYFYTKYTMLFDTPTAYYFYNCAYRPFESKQVFLLS